MYIVSFTIQVFVQLRPHLIEMLDALKDHFELILFTSSNKVYCEAVIQNCIENEVKYFDYMLFKNHCTMISKTNCIKNLDILLKGRDLKDLVIVDNRSENYQSHLRNGIPIIDFQGDETDQALRFLKVYLLERILPATDCREVIDQDFLMPLSENIDADLIKLN